MSEGWLTPATPAAIDDMPAEAYHATDALSSSGMCELLRSPAHYQEAKRTPRTPTPAMLLGTALHTMVLEPHLMDATITTVPDDAPDKRTKEGKVWWPQFRKDNAGKIMLSVADFVRASDCAASVLRHPVTAEFLNEGVVESSLFWREHPDVIGRARPDFLSDSHEVVVDLKTSADASREEFAKSVWNFRYDIQAAWYLNGITQVHNVMPRHYLWCVVETAPPYAVAWYRAERDVVAVAEADIEDAVSIYRKCTQTGTWPGYPQEIQPLHLPKWARTRAASGIIAPV